MKQADTFIIATPAWRFIAVFAVIFIVLEMIDAEFLAFISFVAMILVAVVYRNPERIPPFFQANSIVSVCDGKVISIESIENSPMGDAPCYELVIESGYMDASILRVPFESAISGFELKRGTRLSRHSANFSLLNEKARLAFCDTNDNVMYVQHQLEQSFDNLNINVKHEQHLTQGSRYGSMVKGITTLYLPASSRLAVNRGTRVRAGETLIGYFV